MLALSFGVGMFGVGVSWVYVSIHTYGETAAPLALLLTSLFVLLLALMFALPWLLWSRVRPTAASKTLAFAAIWVITELLRGWIFTGFPWLYLGHAHAESILAGWLPVTGAVGVSFVLALASAATALLLIQRHDRALQLVTASAWVLLAAGPLLGNLQWTSPLAVRSAVLIQPAIPLEDKWNPALREANLQILFDLSEPLWDTDLMVWPEAALPVSFDANAALLNELTERANRQGTSLLTGRLVYKPLERRFYNNLIGLGNASGEYSKRRLVPFGEYVPFENQLRGLIGFFDLPMSTLSAGDAAQPLLLARGLKIAVAICYEIAYAGQTAAGAGEANLIVTVSNDTWFGDSIGPHQHLQLAQVRAVETAKPVLRATNNGISALVASDGHIIASAAQFEATTVSAEFEPTVGSTPFSRWRHWPLIAILFAVLPFVVDRKKLNS